jgi:hypothetical protein
MPSALADAGEEFKKLFGKDIYATAILDVTKATRLPLP